MIGQTGGRHFWVQVPISAAAVFIHLDYRTPKAIKEIKRFKPALKQVETPRCLCVDVPFAYKCL